MVKFQILNWIAYEDTTGININTDFGKYTINIFGKTEDGKSISARVTKYYPYFYIEIPSYWSYNKQAQYYDEILENMHYKNCKKCKKKESCHYLKMYNSFQKYEIVESMKYWGFTNNTLFKFMKLTFERYSEDDGFHRIINNIKHNHKIYYNKKVQEKPRIYESNLEPFLRCMHIQELRACGWVEIHKYKKISSSTCDINIEVEYTNLTYCPNEIIVPFKVLCFDIECTSKDGSFPQPDRDEDTITQIGSTLNYYGQDECYKRHILTLGTCSPIQNVIVEPCKQEEDILINWAKFVKDEDPDIISGYNIFGFDFYYMYRRAKKKKCLNKFLDLSRLKEKSAKYVKKELKSAGLGENILKYIDMPGRVVFDLMKVIQRDDKSLESYKLDFVSSVYIRGKIIKIERKDDKTILYTNNTYGLNVNQYISIYYNDGLTDNRYGYKFKIVDLIKDQITINDKLTDEATQPNKYMIYWCQAKDDVSPKQMFKLQDGSADDRALIAKYCIQDCELCNKLINKLQVVSKNIAMASVCSVPLSYIFMRGQGIKSFSLIMKTTRLHGYLVPTRKKKKYDEDKNKSYDSDGDEVPNDMGYDGAIVFDPIAGSYVSPIGVLDYASLYPSSMIQKNLSHETLVMDSEYMGIDGYIYHKTTFNNPDGSTTTRYFAQQKDGSLGIIPLIEQTLLKERKMIRARQKGVTDLFLYNILEGYQLALKVTANSLYGFTGATVSALYLRDIAAATTATGREMLEKARDFVEMNFAKAVKLAKKNESKCVEYITDILKDIKLEQYAKFKPKELGDKPYNLKVFIEYFISKIKLLLNGFTIKPQIIYGDTDSVFINMNIRTKDKQLQTDINALDKTIKLCMLIGHFVNLTMPFPHNLEYEKTFWPYIIISKKRYVGNKYDENIHDYKQTSMGIVLKRRDNAPIVKIAIGSIVRSMMNRENYATTIKTIQSILEDIINKKYPIEKFITTKTLKDKASYKNWKQQAHVVLADKIAKRDLGNQPQSNDRIPFAFIYQEEDNIKKKKRTLQGDIAEDPKYILENNLTINYLYYITNQIMKPALQFLELICDNPLDVFNNYITMENNRLKGIKPIGFFMNEISTETTGNIAFDFND